MSCEQPINRPVFNLRRAPIHAFPTEGVGYARTWAQENNAGVGRHFLLMGVTDEGRPVNVYLTSKEAGKLAADLAEAVDKHWLEEEGAS